VRRAGRLFEDIASFPNLVLAARRAARGKRRRPEVAAFLFHLETEVLRLERELLGGAYRPGPYRTFWVRDPKQRLIAAAPFRDRVVHHAILRVVEPLFEARWDAHSHACRTGRGTRAALSDARRGCRRWRYFLKLDIRQFFRSIEHERLQALLARIFKDRRLLDLLGRIVRNPVPGDTPGSGLAIGNLCSQHFANVYLDPLDRFVRHEVKPGAYLRYMDDFVLFGDEKAALRCARERVGWFLGQKLGLRLNDRSSLLAPTQQGLPFLGFRFHPGVVRLRPATLRRFRRAARAHLRALAAPGSDAAFDALKSLESLVGHVAQANTRLLRRGFFGTFHPGVGRHGLQPGQTGR